MRRQTSAHRRECASRTANDDILRCSALEPHRVDHDIEENCESKQRRRSHVQESTEAQNGARAKHQSENQCFRARYTAAGNWTHGGARHQSIDVGVVPHIERTCGASSGSYAKKSNDAGEGIDAARCDHETDECGKDDQRHNARFRQRDIVPDAGIAPANGN